MNLLNKTLIFFGICFISEILVRFLPFPFPGSVLAMIILFLLLLLGLIKEDHLEPVTDFFLKNMAFVFLPSVVAIISYVDVFKSMIFRFLFICIITTITTFICTAYSVKLTTYIVNKIKEAKKNA